MTNDTAGNDVLNAADSNDENELKSNDQDSPGQAAKKARLRAAASDSVKRKVTKPTDTVVTQAGKPLDPYASIKKTMRGAQDRGDTSTLRRFAEHLKAMKKPQ